MDVEIREATLKDIEILDSLQNKLGHYESQFDPLIKKKGRIRFQTLKKLRKLIKSKDALVLIAEVNGKAIGTGNCEIKENEGDWSIYPERAWIWQIFVEEKYRRKGVGGKIIKALIDWLHKKKIYDIRVRGYVNNPAVKAYREYGFKDYIFEMNYYPN